MKRFGAVGLAAVVGLGAVLAGAAAAAPAAQTLEQVQTELWSKERAIYSARGRGDAATYVDNASPHYLGWPPQFAEPLTKAQLKPPATAATAAPLGSKEQLEMKFVSLTVSGDAALIYYKTHMTMRADGSPVDLRYEVIHAWVREDGAWRLLGGMARPAVDR